MIDIDSSAEIMFEYVNGWIKHKLHPYSHLLYGFSSQPVKVKGIITLLVELGDGKHIATNEIDFLAMDCPCP